MTKITRRRLLKGTVASTGAILASPLAYSANHQSPAIITADKLRPKINYGVQTGDVSMHEALLWSRADRPARMHIEYSTTESFKNTQKIIGPAALESADYTARIALASLPAGEHIFYRVMFQDLANTSTFSEPVTGHFKTAPASKKDILFQWSGDTAGQGWGINEEWGGMRIYEQMLTSRPDFFIHSGDTIYADGPIEAEQEMPDGKLWKNIVTEEKSKVAETLKEFRGNYQYNMMDKNVRAFNANVPMIMQWDDHETTNNWYPQEILDGDDRYQIKSAALLGARAKQAFLEYTPIRQQSADPEQIFRKISYGSSLDVFVIDMRSYRGPNSSNQQMTASAETDFLGSPQLRWLKQALLASNATWKVIASDMPIGLMVKDGDNFENLSNGDGTVKGREIEMANLLRFIKHSNIKNTVWLTADVHYTAAHYYSPDNAQFTDFNSFWEFVSGPLNAGTFGPGKLDNTFGPEVKFQKAPAAIGQNLPPSMGWQFYGEVKIDGQSEIMTVYLKDLAGTTLYQTELQPAI